MQAVMMTLGFLPRAARRSAKALITGLKRRALSAAIYRLRRTEALPPRIARRPRNSPLSQLKGARPTSAEIFRRLSRPNSGTSAIRVTLVFGPIPGCLDNLELLLPLVVRLNQCGNPRLEASDLLVERIHALLKAGTNELAGDVFLAVHFCGSQLDELPAPGDEIVKFELFFRDLGLDGQLTHGLSEECEHGGVDAIGLGELSTGFGEVSCLPGIDDRNLMARVDQFRDEGAVAPGGFDDDQTFPGRRQLFSEFLTALGIVLLLERRSLRKHVHIEGPFRDVNSDERFEGDVHDDIGVQRRMPLYAINPFFSEKNSTGSNRGATPTALRGRANPFDVRRHAHAEPWAWHPERVNGVECHWRKPAIGAGPRSRRLASASAA